MFGRHHTSESFWIRHKHAGSRTWLSPPPSLVRPSVPSRFGAQFKSQGEEEEKRGEGEEELPKKVSPRLEGFCQKTNSVQILSPFTSEELFEILEPILFQHLAPTDNRIERGCKKGVVPEKTLLKKGSEIVACGPPSSHTSTPSFLTRRPSLVPSEVVVCMRSAYM